MSGKHPKRDRDIDRGEPNAAPRPGLPDRELSAAELRAQMAILAEQVRQLGHRIEHAAHSQPAGATHAQPAEPPALHHSAVVDPTPEPERAQPDRRLPAPPPRQPAASPPYSPESVTDHSHRLFESVIAAAERAALEIRTSAEREAASIRARASDGHVAPTTALEVTLARQRQTLAAFAAETDRIAHAAAVLGAQTRALDAESKRMYETLEGARHSESALEPSASPTP